MAEGDEPVINNQRTGEWLTVVELLDLSSAAELVTFFATILPASVASANSTSMSEALEPFVTELVATAIANGASASVSSALEPFIVRAATLSAGTFSGKTEVEVTSIPSWVKNISVVIDGISFVSSGAVLLLQLSDDNGANYFTNSYFTIGVFGDGGVVVDALLFPSSDFLTTVDTTSANNSDSIFTVGGLQEGAYPWGIGDSSSSENEFIVHVGHLFTSTNRIDAIRLTSEGVSADAGTYDIRGYA